jgi:hypothetical protein
MLSLCCVSLILKRPSLRTRGSVNDAIYRQGSIASPPRRSLTFVITMETLDFRKQYEAMTDETLLNLAMDSEQLSREARNSLDSELSRRGIGRGKIDEYSQDRSRHKGDKKYNTQAAYSLFPSLRRIRATLNDWRKYRHQTAEWPRRSIAFYFLHLLVEIAALMLIVWYSVQHGWSTRIFLVIVLPLM